MTGTGGGGKPAAADRLKSTEVNGVKMYSVSGQKSLATWLPPKKLKSLRKNINYRQKVDVLQDLWFETATTKIEASPDGEYLIASGIYPPQMKVYELSQLSMKFERHLISEIINFQVLTDDYSKIAFLCADRSICLHAKYGSHYSLRIPRMGRDIAYDCWSCDLLCAASSQDLYRVNLEQGRFLSSLVTQSPALNVVSRSKVHGLVACGGDDGAVECFDMRVKSSVGRINAVSQSGDIDQEVTAITFDEVGGLHMAVGSSGGQVLLYDLRSSHPLRIKDHMYGSPIIDIKWHQTLNTGKPKLITTDKHIVRVWDPETGDGMTSIEPTGGSINDVCIFPGSGLMLLALDCSQIPSYFIPALGPAPKWCHPLDHLTEEMEEGAQETVIYDDFKFVTKEDLERLNLTNLIGTNLLRAYMHGFFINYRLYKKAESLVKPFAYAEYIEKKKQEKLEADRRSRITIKRKLPKVNRDLAARLFEDEDAADGGDEINDPSVKKKSSKKKKLVGSELLEDERFKALFEKEDFEVDKFSQEYLSRHPEAPKKRTSFVEEHFEPVTVDDEPRTSDSDLSDSVESVENGFNNNINKAKRKSKLPRLHEVKDERHAEAFIKNISLANEDALPLGERVATLEKQASGVDNDVKMGPGGSRELSFIKRSFGKNKGGEEEGTRERRRGIKSLGLKSDKPSFRGKGGRPRGGYGRGRGRRR